MIGNCSIVDLNIVGDYYYTLSYCVCSLLLGKSKIESTKTLLELGLSIGGALLVRRINWLLFYFDHQDFKKQEKELNRYNHKA